MRERFAARRLPQQPGRSGWDAILPPQSAPRVLEGDVSADIAVIGGGFAGLSAARRLLQLDANLSVALLEAGRIGEGPAGRNSGFMIDLPHDLASGEYGGADNASGTQADSQQTRHNRLAIRFAAEAAEEYAMPAEAFDPAGKINGAASEGGEQHNRSYAAHLQHMGESSEMLDAQAMRAITGSDYYRSGLFTPGTAMLQPALYVRSLARGIATRARICENSPVLALERQQDDWTLRTPAGNLRAARVILAVNGHAESFGFFRRRLLHVFTYASMTRALSDDEIARLGGREKWSITPADPMGTTLRRIHGTGGDRIIVRRRFTCDPAMRVPKWRMAAVGRLHNASFARRFPALSHVSMEYRWGGHLCLSRNSVPAFGEVARGVYAACCQNGLGAAKGTLSGMAAAELVLGHNSQLAQELLACEPPARLPPAPLTWLGANAVMRYKEWQAGAEA